jgi:predicted nucleotide-binding protein (sugar kinase/HSP70/actin superfamily)
LESLGTDFFLVGIELASAGKYVRYSAPKPQKRLTPTDGRVGVPRILAYDELRVFFDRLLESAQMTTVVSPRSTKAILDAGAALSVDDVCMPLKLSLGHVDALVRDRVEVVLVPRYISVAKGRNFCPKFHVLPDIVRSVFPRIGVLAPYIDFHHTRHGDFARHLEEACSPVLWQLGVPRHRMRGMVVQAHEAQRLADSQGEPFEEATNAPVIAMLGHTYAERDSLCGLDVPRKLERLGVRVLRSPSILPPENQELCADIYYEPTHRTARAAATRIAQGVDGIVLLTFFACGPDSYGAELLMCRLARLYPQVPVLRIIADEQCAAEGLNTRLETFVDIVRESRARRSQGC